MLLIQTLGASLYKAHSDQKNEQLSKTRPILGLVYLLYIQIKFSHVL